MFHVLHWFDASIDEIFIIINSRCDEWESKAFPISDDPSENQVLSCSFVMTGDNAFSMICVMFVGDCHFPIVNHILVFMAVMEHFISCLSRAILGASSGMDWISLRKQGG